MGKYYKVLVIITLNLWLLFRLNQNDYGLVSSLIWIVSTFFLYKTIKVSKSIPNHNFKVPPFLLLFLVLIFLVKIIFISYNQSSVFFHGDEAINSRNAQSNFESAIFSGDWNILSSGSGTMNEMPALWYFLQGGIIHFLGPSLVSIKFFALVSDFFLCYFIFLIVKKLFNQSLAIYSTVLYATFPIAIHFSMTGYQNIQSTVMLYWSVYLLSLISYKNNYENLSHYCLSSGIVSGLSLYFYLSSTINPLICLLIILSIFIFESRLTLSLKLKYIVSSISYFIIGVIIPSIPYLYYSIFKYKFISGRSSEFIFDQLKSQPLQTLVIQIKNFLNGFSPFGIFNGSGSHYTDVSLFPENLFFIFFIIGFLISIIKFTQLKYSISLIIFLTTSITGGILTKDPPTSQRLIHLFPIIIFFIIYTVNLIKNKNIQKVIILYFIIMNIISYATKNIIANQKRLDRDVYEIPKILDSDSQELFFSAPIHKKDQIYYYSRGKIVIKKIEDSQLIFDDIGLSKPILINDDSLNSLLKPTLLKYKIIKEWSNIYDHTFLIKLI